MALRVATFLKYFFFATLVVGLVLRLVMGSRSIPGTGHKFYEASGFVFGLMLLAMAFENKLVGHRWRLLVFAGLVQLLFGLSQLWA